MADTTTCSLRGSHGIDTLCDEVECVFWRVADHLDLVETSEGCAIQYFELLGDAGSEVSAWLLSVKERLDAELDEDEPLGNA